MVAETEVGMMRAFYRRLCAINYPALLVCIWMTSLVVLAIGIAALVCGYPRLTCMLALGSVVLISLPDRAGQPFDL
jgi:hypothetical protein